MYRTITITWYVVQVLIFDSALVSFTRLYIVTMLNLYDYPLYIYIEYIDRCFVDIHIYLSIHTCTVLLCCVLLEVKIQNNITVVGFVVCCVVACCDNVARWPLTDRALTLAPRHPVVERCV